MAEPALRSDEGDQDDQSRPFCAKHAAEAEYDEALVFGAVHDHAAPQGTGRRRVRTPPRQDNGIGRVLRVSASFELNDSMIKSPG